MELRVVSHGEGMSVFFHDDKVEKGYLMVRIVTSFDQWIMSGSDKCHF